MYSNPFTVPEGTRNQRIPNFMTFDKWRW